MCYLVAPGAAALTGVVAAVAAPVFSLLTLLFTVLCFTVLTLAAGSVFFVAVAAAGADATGVAAAAVAGAPVWANTGRASADNRAATRMEVDFMAHFLKEKFFNLGAYRYLLHLTSINELAIKATTSKCCRTCDSCKHLLQAAEPGVSRYSGHWPALRDADHVRDLRAEQADHADDDQVERDNEIKQTRHEKNQNASDQRYQRAEGKMNIHIELLYQRGGEMRLVRR